MTAEPARRVLLLAGSQRSREGCSRTDSHAAALMRRMASRLPATWQVDVEDLANVHGRARIQPCNACASVSMALCVWPCNCYRAGDPVEPDLLWDRDLYARLERAMAWAIVGPINWNAPSSNLKLLFDRLVCMNGGNPRPDLIDGKDPERAVALERSPLWSQLSRNHLEGRTAAFFCYGDEGGGELDATGRPRVLRNAEVLDPSQDPYGDTRLTYAPLVLQCRWSGIDVPDDLWRYVAFPRPADPAAPADARIAGAAAALAAFDAWTDRFRDVVAARRRVRVSAPR